MAMKVGKLPAVVPQIYEHEQFGKIRVVTIEGEPWAVGNDAAIALGYTNPRDALAKHVPDKFKGVSQITTPYGVQSVTLISEAGLYKLAMRSKLPKAEEFSDWACGEVLPSIRKHGVYATDDFLSKTLADPDWAIGILTELKATREKNAALENQVAQLKPKAEYCEKILQCDEALPVTVIAKDYGMSAVEFNELLHKLEIQFRVGKQWVLYQIYAGLGYMKTVTTALKNGLTVTQNYWTQKGRMFLYNVLKKHNVLPEIEKQSPMATLL